MTFDQVIIAILLCVIVILEILHQLHIHKLVNKVMSRNYYDYKVSETVDNTINKPFEAKIIQEEVEDFSHMADYSNNVI